MSIFYSLRAKTPLSVDEVAAVITKHLDGIRDGVQINTPTVNVTVTPPGRYEYLYSAEHAKPTISADFYVHKSELLNGSRDALVAAAATMVECTSVAELASQGDVLVMRWAGSALTLFRSTSYWDRPDVLERIPQPYRVSNERIVL